MSMRSIVVAALLLLGTAAHAQKSDRDRMDAAGRQHAELGMRFYGEGRYEAARIEFLAAYELTSHADLLHNLSLVAERQENWTDAIKYEEQFLEAPRAADQVPLSQREQDEAQGRLARLRRNLKPAAQPDASPRPIMAPRADRHAVPRGAIGLMAGGGVVLAIGLGCGAGALAARSALADPGGVFADEYDPIVSRGRALDRTGIALDVVGGLSVAIGAGWAIWARARNPKASHQASATNRYGGALIVRSRSLTGQSNLGLVPAAAYAAEQM